VKNSHRHTDGHWCCIWRPWCVRHTLQGHYLWRVYDVRKQNL